MEFKTQETAPALPWQRRDAPVNETAALQAVRDELDRRRLEGSPGGGGTPLVASNASEFSGPNPWGDSALKTSSSPDAWSDISSHVNYRTGNFIPQVKWWEEQTNESDGHAAAQAAGAPAGTEPPESALPPPLVTRDEEQPPPLLAEALAQGVSAGPGPAPYVPGTPLRSKARPSLKVKPGAVPQAVNSFPVPATAMAMVTGTAIAAAPSAAAGTSAAPDREDYAAAAGYAGSLPAFVAGHHAGGGAGSPYGSDSGRRRRQAGWWKRLLLGDRGLKTYEDTSLPKPAGNRGTAAHPKAIRGAVLNTYDTPEDRALRHETRGARQFYQNLNLRQLRRLSDLRWCILFMSLVWVAYATLELMHAGLPTALEQGRMDLLHPEDSFLAGLYLVASAFCIWRMRLGRLFGAVCCIIMLMNPVLQSVLGVLGLIVLFYAAPLFGREAPSARDLRATIRSRTYGAG